MTTRSPIKTETEAATVASEWSLVCTTADLVANSGVCALIDNKQIAIFAITDSEDNIQLYACDNYDPIGKANVLYRGILSSMAGIVCICSPLYKQHFSLLDGSCLEDEAVSINVYQVRLEGNEVFILTPPATAV